MCEQKDQKPESKDGKYMKWAPVIGAAASVGRFVLELVSKWEG